MKIAGVALLRMLIATVGNLSIMLWEMTRTVWIMVKFTWGIFMMVVDMAWTLRSVPNYLGAATAGFLAVPMQLALQCAQESSLAWIQTCGSCFRQFYVSLGWPVACCVLVATQIATYASRAHHKANLQAEREAKADAITQLQAARREKTEAEGQVVQTLCAV